MSKTMNEKKYYDHLCDCGCESRIEIKPWHKYNGIQRFISGHNQRGKIQSEESNKKRSKAMTGYKNSKESIENNRKAHIGINKGITKEVNPNLIQSEESKEKNRKSHIGRKNSKQSEIMKLKWQDPVYRERMIKTHVGYEQSEETKEKLREIVTGKKRSKEAIERMRVSAIERWQDFEYREKQIKAVIKGSMIKPNRAEKRLYKLLQKLFSNEYLLNVKADMIIGGKVPDFVNVNGQKKLIEMFGDYWHSIEKTGKTKEEEENQRIKHFAKYGYQTLIIWEHELEDLEKVISKILSFNSEVNICHV